MSKKIAYRNLLIVLTFLASLAWFSYIGRYKTIYGAGILAVPAVFIISLLPFFASAFVFMKSWAFSARVYVITSTLFFCGLISIHFISTYKPSLYVNIPQDYEGCVFLFKVKDLPIQDVDISPDGIAYLPDGGDYILKVRIGDKKHPEILNSLHYNQVSYYSPDSSEMHWTDINCLEVGPKMSYDQQEYVYHGFYPCMEGSELQALIAGGIIDSARIQWYFYSFSKDQYYDPQ